MARFLKNADMVMEMGVASCEGQRAGRPGSDAMRLCRQWLGKEKVLVEKERIVGEERRSMVSREGEVQEKWEEALYS